MMNWYLETELQYGTTEWDVLKEIFLLAFSFEDRFNCIDDTLQEIKVAIFRIPVDPITWVQPDWSTQFCNVVNAIMLPQKKVRKIPRISVSTSKRDKAKSLVIRSMFLTFQDH